MVGITTCLTRAAFRPADTLLKALSGRNIQHHSISNLPGELDRL